MHDLGGGERTAGWEPIDGVRSSGAADISQEYPGTLRGPVRECREGGLNMNFMESYFCQVRPSATHLGILILEALTDVPTGKLNMTGGRSSSSCLQVQHFILFPSNICKAIISTLLFPHLK